MSLRLRDNLAERWRRGTVIDGTTWEFPKTGWWASHAVLIAGALWLGYALGRRDNY